MERLIEVDNELERCDGSTHRIFGRKYAILTAYGQKKGKFWGLIETLWEIMVILGKYKQKKGEYNGSGQICHSTALYLQIIIT